MAIFDIAIASGHFHLKATLPLDRWTTTQGIHTLACWPTGLGLRSRHTYLGLLDRASGPWGVYGWVYTGLLNLGPWTVSIPGVGIYYPTGPWPLDRIRPMVGFLLYYWTLDYGL